MKESNLVSNICQAVRREYPWAWVFKVVGSPYQMSGVPDILLCVEGRLFGIEVKRQRAGESHRAATERTTLGQRRQIQQIRAAGGVAGVVLSVEEALDLIASGLAEAGETPPT